MQKTLKPSIQMRRNITDYSNQKSEDIGDKKWIKVLLDWHVLY